MHAMNNFTYLCWKQSFSSYLDIPMPNIPFQLSLSWIYCLNFCFSKGLLLLSEGLNDGKKNTVTTFIHLLYSFVSHVLTQMIEASLLLLMKTRVELLKTNAHISYQEHSTKITNKRHPKKKKKISLPNLSFSHVEDPALIFFSTQQKRPSLAMYSGLVFQVGC